MSRPTPRKTRGHRQQPSGSGHRIAAASDYESDAQHNLDGRDVLPPPPSHVEQRTNEELNLSVLRRYIPNIRSIVAIAPSATVYNFSNATMGWEKPGIEGTLFVCEQEPTPEGRHRSCVFVLNRRSMDNQMVSLCDVSVCEVAGEVIALSLDDAANGDAADGAAAPTRVIGLWIHPGRDIPGPDDTLIPDNTKEVVTNTIRTRWYMSRHSPTDADGTGETPTSGRKLSISELFGNGNLAGR